MVEKKIIEIYQGILDVRESRLDNNIRYLDNTPLHQLFDHHKGKKLRIVIEVLDSDEPVRIQHY